MSERRIHKHEAARRSLAEIAEHFARAADVETALRFLDCAQDTFAVLLDSPRIGHRPDFRGLELGDVRRWSVRDFQSLLVYYRELDDGITILDVIHGAREQEQSLRRPHSPAS